MKTEAKPQIGNSGNTWGKPWEQHNLLKLKAGHSGNSGNTKKTTSINVLQAPTINRLRDSEILLCPLFPLCPNHSLIIYNIIILYIYTYKAFGVGSYFPLFGNSKTALGNSKSQVGHSETSQLPIFVTHYPGFSPLNFDSIGGDHGII